MKGENPLAPGTPESFNVLVKELQSLAWTSSFEERALSRGPALGVPSAAKHLRNLDIKYP